MNDEKQSLVEHRFVGAWLPYANFRGANLREAEFADANARHADFSGADFSMAGVSGAYFSYARFDGAIWNVARGHETPIYRNTDLSQRGFHGMSGTHNRSKRQHMMDPGYGGADMSCALFDGAKCFQTNFSRTILASASFKGADCREALFSNADLRNADFTNADLRGAKMEGANTAGPLLLAVIAPDDVVCLRQCGLDRCRYL